jgi:hypothetical protein
MERRKGTRRVWVVGKDDVGRAILEWRPERRGLRADDDDPSARTYDFLKRLEVPELEILDDCRGTQGGGGRNPYDSDAGNLRTKPPARADRFASKEKPPDR